LRSRLRSPGQIPRGYLWKFEWRPSNYRQALAVMLKNYGEHPDYFVTPASYARAEKTGRIMPIYAHELPARALAERKAQIQKRDQECEQEALQGAVPKDDCPLMDYAIWKPHSGIVLIATEHGAESDPSRDRRDGVYEESQPPLVYGADSWLEAEVMDNYHEQCTLIDPYGKLPPFERTLEIMCNSSTGCSAQCMDVQH
jgi:hypothetical protein